MQALRNFWNGVFLLLLMPVAAQAQKPVPTSVKNQPESSATGEAFSDLMKAWWLWAGIIVILGLVGLLFYLRNKTDDD